MSKDFISTSRFFLHIERATYVFFSFVYAYFEAIALTYVFMSRFSMNLYTSSAVSSISTLSIFATCFYFSVMDGYRILTRNKMQAYRNLKYCFAFRGHPIADYLKFCLSALYVSTLTLGVCYLLPYHFASVYFLNFLALNVHFYNNKMLGYYLAVVVIPNLIINAINIFHNAVVSLRSFYESFWDLEDKFTKKLSEFKSNTVLENIYSCLGLYLSLYSFRLAQIMSLGNYMTYQDHIIHYGVIVNKSVSYIHASRSLFYLLFFRSLGNCLKLSIYLVSVIRGFVDMCAQLCLFVYTKLLKIRYLFRKNSHSSASRKSVFNIPYYQLAGLGLNSCLEYIETHALSVFGYLSCAIRAYARAVTVSGNAPMVFSFFYNFFDKASSNPVATISMQLPVAAKSKKSTSANNPSQHSVSALRVQ